MRKNTIATLIAAGLVAVSTTAASGGCGGSSSDSGGGGTGGSSGGSVSGGAGPTKQLPAERGGTCGIGPHTIETVHGIISGKIDWLCKGAVVLTMNVRLVYLGNNAERETEVDEGSPLIVNSPPDAPPKFVTAPCTTGLWKMKVVGAVTPAIGPVLTINTSDKTGPPFNDPKWQTPIKITC